MGIHVRVFIPHFLHSSLHFISSKYLQLVAVIFLISVLHNIRKMEKAICNFAYDYIIYFFTKGTQLF